MKKNPYKFPFGKKNKLEFEKVDHLSYTSVVSKFYSYYSESADNYLPTRHKSSKSLPRVNNAAGPRVSPHMSSLPPGHLVHDMPY